MREIWVHFLGQEYPLEKEMPTHFNILAWEIPWTEEPGRLQSLGLQRVRHYSVTNTHTHPHTLSLSLSVSLVETHGFLIVVACCRAQTLGAWASVVVAEGSRVLAQ